MRLPLALEKLMDELGRLPGIGPKTAQRLALFIMKMPLENVERMAAAIISARTTLKPCSICGSLADESPCPICRDETRDPETICVTEETSDIMAIERSGYRGQYFVMNRSFKLMSGLDLSQFDLSPFTDRLERGGIKEVILAINPDVNGELLCRFLARAAEPFGVRVTRLAMGLSVGGDIEYTDEITLRRAIEGRREV